MFKNPPSGDTREDVFEQFVIFTLSERYLSMQETVKALIRSVKLPPEEKEAA